MNTVYLERDKYQDMLKWKEYEDRASLYLTGPRQVGKTYLLQKLGREEFSRCVYINFSDPEDLAKIDALMDKYRVDHNSQGFPWHNFFKEFNAEYENEPDTLVIFDEIQESTRWYNFIRPVTRELNSRLAVSGSYLGIARKALGYWEPAGDLAEVALTSLSYTEFLKANGVYDAYSKVTAFNLSEVTEDEKTLFTRVQELYHVYCQIGGYPRVVERWLRVQGTDTERAAACTPIIEQILEGFHRECRRYFPEIVSDFIWSRALQEVMRSIVSRDLDLGTDKGSLASSMLNIELQPAGTYTMLRKDKIAVLRWLSDCHFVGEAGVYDAIPFKEISNKKFQFYLMDLGILSWLCGQLRELKQSDLDGIRAENFVYLYLRERVKHDFIGIEVCTFIDSNSQAEIDFVMWTKDRDTIGIEVKHSHGRTKSGDVALQKGHINKLIKLQDTFGGMEGEKIVLPLFAIDKMPLILND